MTQWGTQRVWVGAAAAQPRPAWTRGRRVDLRFGPPLHVPPDADPVPGPRRSGQTLTAMLEELQQRPHHRPRRRRAWRRGTPPTSAATLPIGWRRAALDHVPTSAVPPTWGAVTLGWSLMASPPKRQRVAAYAVIVRDDQILLSRLSPIVTPDELWTLPGGGLDHGEDPRDAVIREIHEETGLDADVSDTARVYSAHMPQAWRGGPPRQRTRGADRLRRLGGAAVRRSRGWWRWTDRRSRRRGVRSPTCSTAACR